MRDYVTDKTQEVINQSQSLNELSDKAKEEAVAIISSGISDYIDMSGEINYGDKDKIVRMIKAFIKTFDVKADLKFNDTYLVGKLVNILGTEKDTETFISSLSMLFTDKHFSTQLGGEELVEIF
ncbi:Cro/Cl family transcriptional regulator [Enterococcus faecium]|uniref:Cro/Cl family transcriptional regulator n=1 Tax=Enterococcus faecium TaxID=1352 RepID=UPI00338D6F22